MGNLIKDGSRHAEQKLLAAFSEVDVAVTGTVIVRGCKETCTVCEGVFDNAKTAIKSTVKTKLNHGVLDTSEAAKLTEFRTLSRISQRTNAGQVVDLNVASYFP